MEVKIRFSKPKDYAGIKHLLTSTGLVGRWFTKQLFIKLLRKNLGLYFVAEKNGEIIGSIFASHDGGYFGYIYKLVINHSYRREGLASKLVHAVLKKMKSFHIDFVFLHVAKTNIPSQKFFKSQGFKHRTTHLLMDNYQ